MVRFSPGVAQSCHELLVLAKKHALAPKHLLSTFTHIGAIPSDKVWGIAQELNWAYVTDEGLLAPTIKGERLLAYTCYPQLLRQMLLDYIDTERPAWLQNASSGRAKVLMFVRAEIAQVFVEAELAQGVDEQTVAFWDALAALARGQKNDRINEVGRTGERLSLGYESRRTRREPRWVSIESNEDGYDILSVLSADNAAKLSIEVKASTMGMHGYLTENEWERAQEATHHCFHLWDMSADEPRLCILTTEQIRANVPLNLGNGLWQSVKIPFNAFSSNFTPIHNATPSAV